MSDTGFYCLHLNIVFKVFFVITDVLHINCFILEKSFFCIFKETSHFCVLHFNIFCIAELLWIAFSLPCQSVWATASVSVSVSKEKIKCGNSFSFLGTRTLLITKGSSDCYFTPKRDRIGHNIKIASHYNLYKPKNYVSTLFSHLFL